MFGMGDESAGGDAEISPEELRANELLRDTELARAQQGQLEWQRYTAAAELHALLVEPSAGTEAEMRAIDPFAQCAARLSASQEITQHTAELQINRALALRDRLPAVNALLKAGRVAAEYIPDVVSRTELIDGSPHQAEIDQVIAATLGRRGSWSKNRMRDMVDAIIFRRDPDLVRQAREDAKNRRGVWGSHADHGMAVLEGQSTAEEMTMIMARLEKLATSTCKADPRRKADRMADALFATVMGREFGCQCPDDPKHPCTAEIVTVPADQVISGVDVKIVLHVITDQATLEGTADNPGFLDGHGVISAAHVRDIADRTETVQRPMGNKTESAQPVVPEPVQPEPEPTEPETKPGKPTVYMRLPENPTLGEFSDRGDTVDAPFAQIVPLPAAQPGDMYRPSVVLDSYIRIRDCYCVWPGCDKKAWGADLDHTHEYNHHNPDAGGCTHPSEMKTLCRFHHLLKTYSDWLDDQYPDPRTGRPRLIFTTPEGRSYDGPAWTGDDLFPTLRLIVFDDQRGSPGRPPPTAPDSRQQSRTAAKHARRQQERLRNRRIREEQERKDPPPF
ncbi:HNH endonuclease signature motif containing protein [Nocardia sp. 348MFTsu5.1]|uniref:HNH endonuclease signature motif containing protein n=1 Tax=Nocardia sp. 348MFTsu5.1 TaxID=1172185 RepID=UPI00037DE93C|nr:HNH endonuclease signature motif containing protein [Nocardia sp. 348MFTsu5.1]